MEYNFDEVIDRSHTSTYKHGNLKLYFGAEDIIPLWVADMDISTPDFIINAVSARLNHPILGYTLISDAFSEAVSTWLEHKQNWVIKNEWVGFISGVVPGLAISVLTFTNPGDKVLIQSPVYPPFFSTIQQNGRVVVNSQLVLSEGQYQVDFNDFENELKQGVKLFFLCNPHNPGGKVWSKETLKTIAELCEKYQVLVVSDEIHCDLTFPEYTFTPYATVSDAAANHSVTLQAPSKTFNMAGMCASFFVIPNSELRTKYQKKLNQLHTGGYGTALSYVALEAAYNNGNEWLSQLLTYIKGNLDYVDSFICEKMPNIKVIKPEASFLVWLDCKGLKMTDDALKSFFVIKAKVALNSGPTFGAGGENFVRLNIGTPRCVLEQAMLNIYNAYKQL